MKHCISLFISLVFFTHQCYAQANKEERTNEIKLHNDFQKFTDTTLIIKKSHNGIPKSDYFILSKKGKQVNIYFYGDATRSILVPSGIKSAMKSTNFDGNTIKAFENVLFYPIGLTKEDGLNFWQKIMLTNPWEINDDKKNLYCENPSIKLFDGSQISFFIITKKEIKSVSFPSPDFYEGKCPGNKHRKAILKIEELYKNYFRF